MRFITMALSVLSLAATANASTLTDAISKRVVGTWITRDERGHVSRMVIRPGGTMTYRYYSLGTHQMTDEVTTWSVDDNNVSLGDFVTSTHHFRVSGKDMSFDWQPASATIHERWTRIK